MCMCVYACRQALLLLLLLLFCTVVASVRPTSHRAHRPTLLTQAMFVGRLLTAGAPLCRTGGGQYAGPGLVSSPAACLCIKACVVYISGVEGTGVKQIVICQVCIIDVEALQRLGCAA
jgi:hypothetical protein